MPDSTPSEPVAEAAIAGPTGPGPDRTPPPKDSSGSSGTGAAGDWTVAATERIESIVTTLRDRTTVPVTKIARAVVFGLVMAVMGAVALVLGVIGVLRLHVYLPFHPEGRRVWVTYVGLGAIFMLAGAFLWRKRTVRTKE
jgi:hypothetical protein